MQEGGRIVCMKKMIKVFLGSTSSVKLRYLRNVLDEMGIEVEIEARQVESWVAEQPMSRQETVEGAKNRARNVLSKYVDSQIGVGMEAGIVQEGRDVYMICVSVVCTRKGDCYIGESDMIEIPDVVGREIKQGKQFGRLIREYFRKHKNEKVKELVSREKSFSEALKQAWRKYDKS